MPAAVNIDIPSHPFYPLGVDIVGYLANKWSVATLLAIFLAGWVAILGLTWVSVSRYSPRLHRNDKLVILWFVLSKPFDVHRFYWSTDILCHRRNDTLLLRGLFCLEPYANGICSRPVRPTMEGICSL
jgi:hypothetical protein